MKEVIAFSCDGQGAGREVPLEQAVKSDTGFSWVHLDFEEQSGLDWLTNAGFEDEVFDEMRAEETRPRCTQFDDGVLLSLRGVNLNPGAEPEDMIALRLWVEPGLVVTSYRRDLRAIEDVIESLQKGAGPETSFDLVARLAQRLADRAEPVVAKLGDRVDDLEELALAEEDVPQAELGDIRRDAIVLRRYMAPQREALAQLEVTRHWLSDDDREALRVAVDRVTRLAEDLQAIRDRAQVVHEQMSALRSEAMNKQMFVLSIASAIFLPLGFITGLLGINVGGMPGADNALAFWIVCAGLLVLGIGIGLFFRRIGIIWRD